MFYLNWVSWTTAHIQFSFKNSNVVGTEPHHNFKKSNDFFHRYSNPSKYPQNHIQSTLLVTHHQHGEIDFMNEFYECKCKPWLSYIKKKSKTTKQYFNLHRPTEFALSSHKISFGWIQRNISFFDAFFSEIENDFK